MKRYHESTLARAILLPIFFLVTLSGATAAMADVEVTVENVEAATGGEVEVPISVRGAMGLEGIQFVLAFDPQALEIIDVGSGPLAGAADIDLKEREPGTVRVAMMPESALDPGEGTLLLAKFNILAEAGKEVPIGIEEAKASKFDEKSKFPMWMQITTTSGGVRATAAAETPGWLWFAMAAAAVLVLLVGAILLLRRRSHVAPVASPRET